MTESQILDVVNTSFEEVADATTMGGGETVAVVDSADFNAQRCNGQNETATAVDSIVSNANGRDEDAETVAAVQSIQDTAAVNSIGLDADRFARALAETSVSQNEFDAMVNEALEETQVL